MAEECSRYRCERCSTKKAPTLRGQPQSTANASRKPPEIFRKPRSRSGLEPAALHARKNEGLRNRPVELALELIASAAQAVNSDSRVRGMVGSLCWPRMHGYGNTGR